jgi:hypothetical protein
MDWACTSLWTRPRIRPTITTITRTMTTVPRVAEVPPQVPRTRARTSPLRMHLREVNPCASFIHIQTTTPRMSANWLVVLLESARVNNPPVRSQQRRVLAAILLTRVKDPMPSMLSVVMVVHPRGMTRTTPGQTWWFVTDAPS